MESAEEDAGAVSAELAGVFFDSFSDGLTRWTETGEGDFVDRRLSSTAGYPGSGSGGLTASVADCDTQCTLTSQVINVTGGTNAALTFLRFVDNNFDADDYVRVELFDGSTWNRVRTWTGGNGDTDRWVQETIPLNDYVDVPGFRVRFVVRATTTAEIFQLDDVRIEATNTIGVLTSLDIGTTGQTGSTTTASGTTTLRAGGADIFGTSDSFRYLYRTLAGDGQVTARINSVSATDTWTKVGVMIRDSTAVGARNAFMLLRPSEGSAFQWRTTNGGDTNTTWADAPAMGSDVHRTRWLRSAKWIRMTRQGNVFRVYTSDDGACWQFRREQTVRFEDQGALFGVALTSHNTNSLATASVSNFEVKGSIDPIDASCDRAAVDGDLPIPTDNSWIFQPGRFGATSNWSLTTTNPNGIVTPELCNPGEADEPPNEPRKRRDGPDHPNCPQANVSPAWTRTNFTPGTTWQTNQAAGIGVAGSAPGDRLVTTLNSRAVWLRRNFTITSDADRDSAVLWGRWDQGISVYINGQLATSNPEGTGHYRYLGLSDEARAAIVVNGTNVIAVRLEWDAYTYNASNQVVRGNAGARYFDLGMARSLPMADLPVHRMTEPRAAYAGYVTAFKEALQEQGISGATLAINKDGQLLVSAGVGWRDKHLTTQMPRDAVMRLASNDKVITRAAIARLVGEGRIAPNTRVFPQLNLTPIPGMNVGANVNTITVDHLLTHRSGIGHTDHNQYALDEVAFRLGIPTAQLTSVHNARWLLSLNATDVGGAERYSSNGYFLLRYLVEQLVAPRTLEQYLAEGMGLTDTVITREPLAQRHAREPGYITREAPWDRWMALDDYLAIGASAPGYAGFFQTFGIGYNLSNGTYVANGGGVADGAMAGTWTRAIEDDARGLSIVLIANSLGGGYDELARRVENVHFSNHCLFGPVDPRTLAGTRHLYIQSVAQDTQFINHENGLRASAVAATAWSTQWVYEPVDGTHFRLRNRWLGSFLNLAAGTLGMTTDPALTSAHWVLVAANDGFRIRNRAQSTSFLNTQNGQLRAGTIQTTWPSAHWRFCN